MSEDKKKNTVSKKQQSINIDYDKLTNAIVLANKHYDEAKELEKQAQLEKEQKEWYRQIGYNKEKHLTIIPAFFRMLVMCPKNIKGDRATSTLLSFIASSILSIAMIFMFLLTTVSLIAAALADNYITTNILPTRLLFLLIALFGFIFGNLFRISVHEIQNVQDRDYLNTILSSILTVVGTVFALVELFRG